MLAFIVSVLLGIRPAIDQASLSEFRKDTYIRVSAQAEFSAAVREQLRKNLQYPLAEPADEFNSTDVLLAGRINRRFLVGFVSSSHVLLAYEHGGGGNDEHIIAFRISPNGELSLAFHMALQGADLITHDALRQSDTLLIARLLAARDRWMSDHY